MKPFKTIIFFVFLLLGFSNNSIASNSSNLEIKGISNSYFSPLNINIKIKNNSAHKIIFIIGIEKKIAEHWSHILDDVFSDKYQKNIKYLKIYPQETKTINWNLENLKKTLVAYGQKFSGNYRLLIKYNYSTLKENLNISKWSAVYSSEFEIK